MIVGIDTAAGCIECKYMALKALEWDGNADMFWA